MFTLSQPKKHKQMQNYFNLNIEELCFIMKKCFKKRNNLIEYDVE